MSNLLVNGLPLDKAFKFSAGEVQIRLPDLGDNNQAIQVTTILDSSDSIMELILTKDALDFYYPHHIKFLKAHYLPYARQDRRCSHGESHSAQVMLDLLDSMKFYKIQVLDVHSDMVLCDRIDNVFHELSILDVFKLYPEMLDGVTALVSPDKGAVKKVKSVANHFNLPIIIADKIRSPDTGYISSVEITQGIEYISDGSKLLIIDDICDGGGTFSMVMNAMVDIEPNIRRIELYVSHGIFSKGLEALDGFDKIYTTDSICKLEDVSDQPLTPDLVIVKV